MKYPKLLAGSILIEQPLTLSQTSPGFLMSAEQSFENTVGKGEIARNEQFLLFPLCFLILFENFLSFFSNLKL